MVVFVENSGRLIGVVDDLYFYEDSNEDLSGDDDKRYDTVFKRGPYKRRFDKGGKKFAFGFLGLSLFFFFFF
jgi:hypothetical protein